MLLTQEQRIKGSLLGLAWGDILGCPVEGWRDWEIETVYGQYEELPQEYPLEKIGQLNPKKLKRLRPLGLHSDDTQQALALIQICLEEGCWSKEAWGSILVKGMGAGTWRGYGRNFSGAVSRLVKGNAPEHSGSASAGMGAAMRVAPLGGIFWDCPQVLAQATMEASLTTHADLRAGALAYAVTYTVAALIAGDTPKKIKKELPKAVAQVESEWLTNHLHWTIERPTDNLVSQGIEDIFSRHWQKPEQLRSYISQGAKRHLAKGFTKAHPNQGFVLLGGLHGLAMALSHWEDPNLILTEIIAQGYDTDTVAAICGGVLGARFGVDWIPLERFQERERLVNYGEVMAKSQGNWEGQEDFLREEARLTKQEADFKEEGIGS